MSEVYRKEYERRPLIRTERGTWSNHHRLPNGDIGERVTERTATHFSRWIFTIEEKLA